MSLAGRFALITGGGSGIGRALAIEASRRGMSVALVGRRRDKLEETRARLAAGSDCLIVPADVTSPDARRAVRDRVQDAWGRLHVLVNNAGIVAAGPLAETEDADLERLMATNVVAPMAMTRELLPLLRAGEPARVVNLGSMFGDIAFPMFAAYSASKFGLRGLSNALRRELAGLGIGVTYVAPRGARTEATQAIAPLVQRLDMTFDSPDAIAHDTWNAVARGRDAAYPRGAERLFTLIERLAPSLIDRALTAQLRRSGIRRLIDDAVAPLPPTTT